MGNQAKVAPKLLIQRYSDNGDSTLGLLFFGGKFFCYSIEDEFRAEKVKGETRIPAGTYQVKYNKELTPLTEKYRKKYDWFRWHIQICNIPNFNNVYIHIGNDEGDTDACVLTGDTTNNNQIDKGFIGYSEQAFKRLYFELHTYLDREKKMFIEIIDENLITIS